MLFRSLVPSQRRTGDELLLELPRYSINQGFYYIVQQGDTLDLVALNLSKKESFLKPFSGEEMRGNLGGGKNISLFNTSSPATFSTEIKERYLGITLWKQALILALLFLLAEIVLIRFFK